MKKKISFCGNSLRRIIIWLCVLSIVTIRLEYVCLLHLTNVYKEVEKGDWARQWTSNNQIGNREGGVGVQFCATSCSLISTYPFVILRWGRGKSGISHIYMRRGLCKIVLLLFDPYLPYY